jgi:prepilin-type N-terminal cleavage/methylation domain-containing protein
MRSRPACRRRGFTLIEMLLVIGILIILITLAALFLPNLDRNKGVPNAVTQVEGWIRLSKNQALRDGAPRGIRLIPDPNNPTQCRQLQYIEQPDPLAPKGTTPPTAANPNGLRIGLLVSTVNPNPAPAPPPYPNPLPSTATLVLIDPATNQPVAANNWDDPLNPQILPGDFLELTGSPSVLARIMPQGAPPQGAAPSPTFPGSQRSTLLLDRSIDGTDVAPLLLTDGFRVIRSPRPLAGEPALDLHKDVYIDFANCYPCPVPLNDPNTGLPVPSGSPPYGSIYTAYQPWSPTGSIDILFNSNGLVANSTTGQLIVAVRHVDRPNDMIFVVIYTRTGKVTAVPVFDAPNQDPYGFARDGRSPGL